MAVSGHSDLGHRIRAGELFAADVVNLVIEGLLYAISLGGPVWLLWKWRDSNPIVLTAVAVCGLAFAGVVFLAVLVAMRRILFPRIPSGRFLLRSPRARPHLLSARIMAMMERSPFRAFIRETAPLRFLFYRGMGAKIEPAIVLASDAVIADPWFFSAGRNCILGVGSLVTCHFVQQNVVTLEPVALGDDVVIGARAFVSPGVRIGSRSVIGANSFIPRRTIIGEGEYWSGNPARAIQTAFAAAVTESKS
jgi:acetyltransferase-like isoleucine patch superfamily enzyme